MESQRGEFNSQDRKDWANNVLLFLAPLGIVYLLPVIAVLQISGHTITINDFIPTSFTFGAMVLYVANAMMDFLRKLASKGE